MADKTRNEPWAKQGTDTLQTEQATDRNHGHNFAEWQRIAADLASHLTAAHTQGCCPNCMTTVDRYRSMRDGTYHFHDTTVTPYAGDPRNRQ